MAPSDGTENDQSSDGRPQYTGDRCSYMMNHVLEKKLQHRLAATFFRARYTWWWLIPSAVLTLLCTVISAFEPSSRNNEDGLLDASSLDGVFRLLHSSSFVVGLCGALSTFLQAVGSYRRYVKATWMWTYNVSLTSLCIAKE